MEEYEEKIKIPHSQKEMINETSHKNLYVGSLEKKKKSK